MCIYFGGKELDDDFSFQRFRFSVSSFVMVTFTSIPYAAARRARVSARSGCLRRPHRRRDVSGRGADRANCLITKSRARTRLLKAVELMRTGS